MHFQGKEIISRSTHVAHRSLISVASIAILSNLFDFKMYGENGIKIFGMGFPEGSIAPITFIILVLLSINYGLNYRGDYVSFKHWNIDDKPGAGETFSYPLDTRYEATFRKVSAFHEAAESLLDAKDDKCKHAINILDDLRDKVLGSAEGMDKNLKILIKGHSQLDRIAKIQLYIWYGFATVGLVFWAIYLSFDYQLIDLILNLIP